MAQDTSLKLKPKARKLFNDVITAQKYIDTTVTPLTNADNYDVFDLPKGALVHSAGIVVHTVEGQAETIDLGVTGALTQFLDDQSVNGLGAFASAADAPYIAIADIALTLLANAALTVMKITVFATYSMIENVADKG